MTNCRKKFLATSVRRALSARSCFLAVFLFCIFCFPAVSSGQISPDESFQRWKEIIGRAEGLLEKSLKEYRQCITNLQTEIKPSPIEGWENFEPDESVKISVENVRKDLLFAARSFRKDFPPEAKEMMERARKSFVNLTGEIHKWRGLYKEFRKNKIAFSKYSTERKRKIPLPEILQKGILDDPPPASAGGLMNGDVKGMGGK